MDKKSAWPAAGLVLVLTLSACAAVAQQRPAEPPPSDTTGPGPDYLVGPGDTLQVFVWDRPELTTSVQVRPDGKISSPLVKDLQAASKTTSALARDIEGVLSEFVRSPVVTVSVLEFVGNPSQQVRVIGQAVKPSALLYRQGMTVLDVVIEVGGLSEFAAGNRARIVRNVNGKQTEIRVKIDDILKGKIGENRPMMPGDVLVIPQSVL